MKEAIIRAKALKILESEGYTCWVPRKVKYWETDIFGVFDIVATGSKLRFIQITTLSHISDRRKKVRGFLDKLSISFSAVSEVWGWDKKHKRFKIEVL